MKPTLHVLGIHLPRQKIVLTSGPDDALEKIDIPSPLERYFGRPIDRSYDQLTYIDSRSRYSVDARPASCDVDKDVCEPDCFANLRKNSVVCILLSVHPRMHELFAIRLLLRRFPARSWGTSDITMVKCIRLSMRLLANLDWYRIQTMKSKSVSKMPLISRDRQVISVPICTDGL
jgi:hypothetical protein